MTKKHPPPSIEQLFAKYPRSKREAIEKGETFFFTGIACKAGHIAERYINAGCVPCAKLRAQAGHEKQKARKKAENKAVLESIQRHCKRPQCGKSFSPKLRRDQVFCSQRCADLQGRMDWKQRNPERYQTSEKLRLKRKYNTDPAHGEKIRAKSSARYHALSSEEKTSRSRKARQAIGTENLRKYFRSYHRERSSNDINFRIAGTLRARIRAAVSNKAGTKAAKTIELVGCSLEQLRYHLESLFAEGMSWDNFGQWHIDHIRPCASFLNLGTSEIEQRECFHYKNLQPLWAEDNMRKGPKYKVATDRRKTRGN